MLIRNPSCWSVLGRYQTIGQACILKPISTPFPGPVVVSGDRPVKSTRQVDGVATDETHHGIGKCVNIIVSVICSESQIAVS